MGIRALFSNFFKPDKKEVELCCRAVSAEYIYKKFAVECCVNLIAGTVARCEFRTHEKKKEIRKDSYYLLNVAPNQNENATEFWKKAISKLLKENECLIVQIGAFFYVADDYTEEKYALYENIYQNVIVEDYPLKETFTSSQVFKLRLNHQNINDLLDELYNRYGKLLSLAVDSYKKSNTKRGFLKVKTALSNQPNYRERLQSLMDTHFRTFFNSDGHVVVPLSEGYEYEENSGAAVKDSKDVNSLLNEVFNFACMAFGIPKGLFKNDIVDVSKITDNLLIFCIIPIAELIANEINRVFYGKKAYLKGNYVKVDTQRIKNIDISVMASSLDKLFRIGYSVNDTLRLLGQDPIDEEWANEHFVTKNYENVKNLKGGEENAKKSNDSNP